MIGWDPGSSAIQLDHDFWMLDLGFRDRREIVAAYLLKHPGGAVLIECGPGSTLTHLERALAQTGTQTAEITDLIVTHIHLDHAGAAGLLARQNPALRVHVHPFGAPHLVDPTKLVASATRIYGDQMETLWGEFAAIPSAQVNPLADGQRFEFEHLSFEVIFTPGHAWHHVAIWHEESGVAITGDVAGVSLPGSAYVCPPTPPPDLDIAAWAESIRRLRDLKARRLLLTHFSMVDDLARHFDHLEAELAHFMQIGERAFHQQQSLDELAAILHARMEEQIGAGQQVLLENLELATPSSMAAMGMQRFFAKRAQATN